MLNELIRFINISFDELFLCSKKYEFQEIPNYINMKNSLYRLLDDLREIEGATNYIIYINSLINDFNRLYPNNKLDYTF